MKNLANLQIGDALDYLELEPVSRIELIKYAGASGDYNPIHTIDEEAKNAGLPGIIAHGMWTMGNLAKLFTPFYEEGFVQDYSIRFKDMVFLNDILTLKAKIVELRSTHFVFDVAAVNQHGKEVIKGNLVFKKY